MIAATVIFGAIVRGNLDRPRPRGPLAGRDRVLHDRDPDLPRSVHAPSDRVDRRRTRRQDRDLDRGRAAGRRDDPRVRGDRPPDEEGRAIRRARLGGSLGRRALRRRRRHPPRRGAGHDRGLARGPDHPTTDGARSVAIVEEWRRPTSKDSKASSERRLARQLVRRRALERRARVDARRHWPRPRMAPRSTAPSSAGAASAAKPGRPRRRAHGSGRRGDPSPQPRAPRGRRPPCRRRA